MLPTDRAPTSPAEMLREEFLLPMKLSAAQLAARSGLGVETVEGVLAGRVAVSPEIAEGLGRGLQLSAQFWLNLQARVEQWKVLDAEGDRFDGGME